MTFTKRKRFWYCEKCGAWYHRHKMDDYKYHCGEPMMKSRTLTNAHRISSRDCNERVRLRKKINSFKEKYESKVRNSGGKVMKFSVETKQLWKKIKKSKTIPTFIKYSDLWLISLEKDSRNIGENDWAKSINKDGTITGSRGGMIAPKIVITKNTTYKHDGEVYGNFGMYHTHILRGINQIEISRDRPLHEMKKTLIHEALHYLDGLADMKNGNHDCYWDIRLDKMNNIFKLKEVN